MLFRAISLLLLGVPLYTSALAAQGTLVVVNQKEHSVELVDPASKSVETRVPVGINGHEVAVSKDGKLAYVPIYSNVGVGKPGTNGQTIDVVDIASHTVVRSIDLGKPVRPHRAIFGPDGLLYVSAELDDAIYVVDTKTGTVVGKVPTGAEQSHMFYFSPDGKRIYTANVGEGSVSVIDVKAKKVLTTIPLTKRVQRMVVSKDGRWVFTSDWDLQRIAVIDTKTDKLDRWIATGAMPYVTEPTPDGKELLIGETSGHAGLLEVLDLATMTIIRSIPMASLPNAFLVHDGLAYMSCPGNGAIEILQMGASSPQTWALLPPIKLTPGVDGLGWSPITPKP